MHNIEEVHCGAVIHAAIQANLQLMDATAEEALQGIAYGKADTLGLDGITESAISSSLRHFDRGAVLITEELGKVGAVRPRAHHKHYPPTFYLSDPTDRSAQLREFLSKQDLRRKVGEILRDAEAISSWEQAFGAPATITGATSAVTSIRYGVPIATAIVNFVTQELYVADRFGVYALTLPSYVDLEPDQFTPAFVRSTGRPILFRSFGHTGADMNRMRHFVTFLGKTGYQDNFRDSDLIKPDVAEKYLRHEHPGGPSRALYLSTIQPRDQPVGFVLANGEKIGEWIHWIPFVRFGKTEGEPSSHALKLYEIHQTRPWTKDGILMSTPLPYSIFTTSDNEAKMVIDVDKLRWFSDPSRVRSTLLVAPSSNSWAIALMERHLYREVDFADPH
jgi:hypothetical protein